MRKKLVSLGMVSTLTIGLVVGCGGSDDSKKKSNYKDSSVKKYYELTGKEEDKEITITWGMIGEKDEYYQHYWEEMKGLQAIQDITGVNIDFEVKVGYEDYLPMISAQNYPDVMTANHFSKYPGRMATMYEDGVSIRLNEYMEEWMPNFSKLVEEYPHLGQELRLDDGSYTFLSTLYDVYDEDDRISTSTFGLALRKDWLDTLGYESVPTTMDEWYQVLMDFKHNDPNGDGQSNEEPICLASSCWKYFLPAYGIDDDPSIIVDENGKETVIYGYVTEYFKEYLAEFKKWNDEGLIYNMFQNTSLEKRQERVIGNIAGAWKGESHQFDEQKEDSYINQIRQVVPEAEFAACPWPKTEDGKHWCFSDINSFAREQTVITNNAVKNGKDKAAAYIIDYMLGESGSTLLTWGIEGESYEVVNGEKKLKDDMNEIVEFYDTTIPKRYTYADPLTSFLPGFGEIGEYSNSCQSEEFVESCKVWAEGDSSYKMVASCQLNVDQINELNNLDDQMKTYASKMRHRFITGAAPLTEYDAYVAQMNQLGADKYLELWQEAYENYKNR